MAAKKVSEVRYEFPYGESHAHTVVAATDIAKLDDNKPGLYAWYVRVLPGETAPGDLSFYGGFFGSKKYTVDLRATLGEQYQGNLKMSTAFDPSRPANMALISTVTTAFSPPIYIGIAKNMRNRLLSHMRKLEDALITPFTAAIGSGIDDDSDEESSFFGGRVGDLLRLGFYRYPRLPARRWRGLVRVNRLQVINGPDAIRHARRPRSWTSLSPACTYC